MVYSRKKRKEKLYAHMEKTLYILYMEYTYFPPSAQATTTTIGRRRYTFYIFFFSCAPDAPLGVAYGDFRDPAEADDEPWAGPRNLWRLPLPLERSFSAFW